MKEEKKYKCEKDLRDIIIKERIGSPSLYGQVFRACLKNSDCKLAFKKIRLTKEDIDILYYYYCKDKGIKDCNRLNIDKEEVIKYHKDYRVMRQSVWTELLMLNLCNILLNEKVSINVPRTYAYYFCNNCKYQEEEGIREYPCVLLITELQYGDIYKWLKKERTTLELNVMLFQILAGLYALRKYFDITHYDLHGGNILVKKIEKRDGEYIRYMIDGVEYNIPNIGYIFIIWDFGYSKIPGKIREISKLKEYYEEVDKEYSRDTVDYIRISSVLKEIIKNKDINLVLKYILKCGKENIPLQELITIFVEFKTRLKKEIYFCSLDKEINIPKEYEELSNKMMIYERGIELSRIKIREG